MARMINRDPFARQELWREEVEPQFSETCKNCGNFNGNGRLFRYYTESDNYRKSQHKGLFCSKGCHDSYYL